MVYRNWYRGGELDGMLANSLVEDLDSKVVQENSIEDFVGFGDLP